MFFYKFINKLKAEETTSVSIFTKPILAPYPMRSFVAFGQLEDEITWHVKFVHEPHRGVHLIYYTLSNDFSMRMLHVYQWRKSNFSIVWFNYFWNSLRLNCSYQNDIFESFNSFLMPASDIDTSIEVMIHFYTSRLQFCEITLHKCHFFWFGTWECSYCVLMANPDFSFGLLILILLSNVLF